MLLKVSLLIFCIIAGFFTSYIDFGHELDWVSALFVILFALPAFIYTYKAEHSNGLLAIAGLMIFGLLFEAQSIITGFPYSNFEYGHKLGQKLFGLVPWTVAFAWPPLVIGAFAICKRKIIPTAIFLMAIDLVLDPGATSLQFWVWQNPGPFYGVPTVNFIGWLVSGAFGALILHKFTSHSLSPKGLYSLILSLSFWTSVTFFEQLYIASLIGVIMLVHIFVQMQKQENFLQKIIST